MTTPGQDGPRRPSRRPSGTSGKPAPRVRPAPHGTAARVELISIGHALLRGRIGDDNARAIAERLSARGAVVRRITIVDDDERAVTAALTEALDRNPQLVVTSGGLGPGEHDCTLSAVAEALGRPLTPSTPAREMIEAAYRSLRERKLVHSSARTAARDRLYRIPVGAEPVRNPLGVCPGVLCRLPGGCQILCLPGQPRETGAVLDEALELLTGLDTPRHVVLREIEAPTSDETSLVPLLEQLAGEFPGVWIDSRPAGGPGSRIRIGLEVGAPTEKEAETTADRVLRRLLALAAGGP